MPRRWREKPNISKALWSRGNENGREVQKRRQGALQLLGEKFKSLLCSDKKKLRRRSGKGRWKTPRPPPMRQNWRSRKRSWRRRKQVRKHLQKRQNPKREKRHLRNPRAWGKIDQKKEGSDRLFSSLCSVEEVPNTVTSVNCDYLYYLDSRTGIWLVQLNTWSHWCPSRALYLRTVELLVQLSTYKVPIELPNKRILHSTSNVKIYFA